MVSFYRACESERADALVRDPFAVALAAQIPDEQRARFSRGPMHAKSVDILAIRTRAIDERVLAWVDEGVEQIVNLGGGLDARAYRLPFSDRVCLYDVDTPAVIALADRIFAGEARRVRRVPLDLLRATDLGEALARAGVDRTRPIGWILEGLIEFLGTAGASRLLGGLGAQSQVGSRLLCQVLDPALVRLAQQRGDAAFPWKRLPPVESALAALESWRVWTTPASALGAALGRPIEDLFHLVEGELVSRTIEESLRATT